MFDKTIRNTQAHDLRQIAVLAEERADGFSHAAAQGSVLDGHHTTELTSDLVQQLLVERLGETQVVMGHPNPVRLHTRNGLGSKNCRPCRS